MYVPLYVKSDYSLLSSLIIIDEYIKYALEYNFTSIALTEENTMSQTIEFYNECLKHNLKPIIGLELSFEDAKILLYAKNIEGYKNLTKLVTIKSSSEITIEDLKNHKNDLLCIIPFKYKNLYQDLKNIYLDLYLGYKNEGELEEIRITTSNSVYINETLYFEQPDDYFLKHANLIKDGKKLENIKDYKYDNNYLKKSEKVDFSFYKSTIEVANLCNLTFETQQLNIPQFINDKNMSSKEYLIELSKFGLKKRLDNKITKTYADRLLYELDIITNKNFSDYFLIVADYVKYAKSNNISVGPGRGSAAGSLVSYSLGITDIDPIKYDLLFERFLNPERILMPDIDIDFEDERRDEVIEYVIKKYGEKRVAKIITYGTLSAKLIIRDISRVFDLPVKLVDKINSYIDLKLSLVENYKSNKKLNDLIMSSNDLKEMFKIATKLENKKRHISIHAAGIIMSNNDLDEIVPLVLIDSHYAVGYTMNYLEELGLLKMDFLGLKNLTIIKNIVSDIKKYEKIDIDLSKLDIDDETINIFKEVKTKGVFQFESEGMKNFISKLQIDSFDDITSALALFRPGPMDNIDLYIKNKKDKYKLDYIHKDLEDILKPTYGVIVYQEQIMQIASTMASYSLGEADVLRRAISKKKKDIILSEEEKFLQRAKQLNYDDVTSKKVFDLIVKFADYGFNKAHSVSYAKISYQMAFLKSHYPKYFFLNLLNNYVSSEQRLLDYISDAKKYNVTIKLPSINYSNEYFALVNKDIMYGLTAIKGLGYNIVSEIINIRKEKPYTDIIYFVSRILSKNINKKTIEKLIDASCFDEFGYNHNTLHHNLDIIINYAMLIKDLNPDFVEKPIITVINEFSSDELQTREFETFGFYINGSPVLKYKDNNISTLNINNYFDKTIDIYLKIDQIKEIKTKKNDSMCFIIGSDEDGTIDVVLFPETYKDYPDLSKDQIIKVKGTVEKRNSKHQIIVKTIEIIK